VVRRRMLGVDLDGTLVGVLRPAQIARVEVQVAEAEVDGGLLAAVLQRFDQQVDPGPELLPATVGLGLLERLLAELKLLRVRQLGGVRERRYAVLSATACMSIHVRYLGLPFSLLWWRSR